MKVLLINNDKGWSGGQEHLKDLSIELRRLGVEVWLAVRVGSLSAERYSALGFQVVTLARHGLGHFGALARLARLLRRERFDIVSVNREHDLALTVAAIRLAFPLGHRGRLMMSYHTATSRAQPLLAAVDAVVCISEHVRDRLLTANPAGAGKVSILYYGIAVNDPPPPEKYDPDRPRRFFTGTGFPLIGMVGEMWKNQGELMEVAAILRRDFPSLTVALVGDHSDPQLFSPLQEHIRQLGLEGCVVFTGRVPRERIPDIFHDFDLSVTTHRNEGFGIVHLESLAAGTPVVSYDEGGMVDIFRDEKVGELVHGGPAEFAEAVAGILRDHDRRFALGREGYELVCRSYSRQGMAVRYLDFYRQLAGR